MHIRLAKDVLELFPEASIHCLVVEDLTCLDESLVQVWRDRAAQDIAARSINTEVLGEEKEVKEWREAYRTFGVKPKDYPSSIEALLKRAAKGKLIQTGIPSVDLYCYISLIARSPMGAYDLSKIKGNLAIRRSKQGEEFFAIGEKEPWYTPEGMVVYSDDTRVLCWAWNHRDSNYSCLENGTERAIFFADSSSMQSRKYAEKAITLLAEALAPICKVSQRFTLDAQKTEEEIV